MYISCTWKLQTTKIKNKKKQQKELTFDGIRTCDLESKIPPHLTHLLLLTSSPPHLTSSPQLTSFYHEIIMFLMVISFRNNNKKRERYNDVQKNIITVAPSTNLPKHIETIQRRASRRRRTALSVRQLDVSPFPTWQEGERERGREALETFQSKIKERKKKKDANLSFCLSPSLSIPSLFPPPHTFCYNCLRSFRNKSWRLPTRHWRTRTLGTQCGPSRSCRGSGLQGRSPWCTPAVRRSATPLRSLCIPSSPPTIKTKWVYKKREGERGGGGFVFFLLFFCIYLVDWVGLLDSHPPRTRHDVFVIL